MNKLVASLLGCALGCSSHAGGVADMAAAGSGSAGGSLGASGTPGAAGTMYVAGEAGDDAGSSGSPIPSGGAPDITDYLALPDGSRELDGVVNLVDPGAAQQLDDFLVTDHSGTSVFERHSLDQSLNLFLEHYEELYDFVIFLTDHPLPQTNFIGKFEEVSRPPLLGTGITLQIAADNYKTNGRVKGVIGVQYLTEQFGPFAHEIFHYWANYLDPKFGFGPSLKQDWGPHWGFAGVHGQLGGFDQKTLVCETPSGALPPGCTPLAGGRTAYVVDRFAPQANGPSIPFAPLELYLMGLLPLAEVPPQITVLSQGAIRDNSYNADTGKVVVEASGIQVVPLSDIVVRHGQVAMLPEDQRAFRAVFVVLSAAPVSDTMLSEVANWSAILGNHRTDPILKSFQWVTGDRATLETRLGARRKAGESPPQVRPPFSCDLLHNACSPLGSSASCYANGQNSFCSLPGSAKRGESCTQGPDCVAGMECRYGKTSTNPVCEPRCDPTDATSPIYCASLCPDYILLSSSNGKVTLGQCTAP